MTLRPIITTGFKKDMKRAKKRGKDANKIKTIMKMLTDEQSLSTTCQDHSLIGQYSNYRECHIEPDWLLIYKINKGYIIFARTGTHSDLF